jgi:site-specific recombinase XerD
MQGLVGRQEVEKRPRRLLDQVRDTIRVKHYAIRTEEAYVAWIKRYILFHNKRHPRKMGVSEIEAFLTHLAVEEHVAASTQNQALSTLLFLYREVLGKDLERPIDLHPRPQSGRHGRSQPTG